MSWENVPLGKCCEIVSGATPRRNVPEYWSGDIAWATPKDISGIEGAILFDTPEYISKAGYKSCSARILPKDTILFSSRAPIGLVAIAGRDMCTNQGFKSLIPGPDVDSTYLYYCMKKYANRIAALGSGATFKEVSKEKVSTFPIPLPPLKEQKRIAAILDKADAIRRKRRKAIQLADEFLRSVFLDMFGGTISNPKKWKIGHIQDLCEEIIDCPHATPRYTAGQTDFACIRSSDIQNGYMDWSSTKYVDEVEYKKRIKRLEPVTNDVIYCREGARFGNAARIPKGRTICLGQRMMLFRSKHIVSTAEYIWSLLNSNRVYQQAVQRIGGSASPHINVKDIKKFRIFSPPLSIQQNYSAIVKKIDAMKEKFQKSSLRSEQLFNSLSQRAFRGEL
ncbi:MAG: restriction endonuclease subunit S [Desulfobacterales bacterium]|jgi:type I restriction enzyme S subunit